MQQKIPFVIRVKGCFVAEGIQEEGTARIDTLCKGLGRKRILNRPIILWGLPLYVSIEKKNGAKEPMIVVSSHIFQNALLLYRRRWEIETIFGCLKTRGFRMEDTHITDADKIERLIFVLAIAFCWAYCTGDIAEREDPIPIKSHGRRAKSYFRRGLDQIRQAIFRNVELEEFRKLLKCFTNSHTRSYAA